MTQVPSDFTTPAVNDPSSPWSLAQFRDGFILGMQQARGLGNIPARLQVQQSRVWRAAFSAGTAYAEMMGAGQ